MKKILCVSFVAMVLLFGATAQVKNGAYADKVIYDVKMDQTIAIKDTAEGKTDVFFTGLDGKTYKASNRLIWKDFPPTQCHPEVGLFS